jgi:pSer/pThr/pTyr-binding forkhead associated (FHA) protein
LSSMAIIIGSGVILGIVIFIIVSRRGLIGGKGQSQEPDGSWSGDNAGRILIQSGPLHGSTYPVTEEGPRIGRDPAKCQIVINEETVSREHAIIFVDVDGLTLVKNLSGTNPTYVNDRPVQEMILKPEDKIRVGNSEMLYLIG